ncbi:family 2 glycosyl transferase [Leptolyngbya boryana NIES-2135]|jgi:galactofuranosylgalactofuranosylrhamnosyl-N-acetylglucosaminyl-diphospho-decaprenol beta-1,5/1,6-galactofuranosyltransferase|uniref:Family 2 glycosyl transferase n=1 Tax=Leptolyngbya boryana NIES-2135 TaxID=1973484 RepID=A0A1Z4JC61_LEPBY|nr:MULTISPECIES: glycosyltransferase family 2 protein [Leptolyngbya]BAY54047.1 family 2 glycosyl transferase [Leptolyngbya boryana NIES-2135]MBD2369704.1 glycosyltransferase family 2 protein [Leptolyngbya sp. FACHB-161]MBD2376095.1 glycosyltransferase family 2 protein [Leptolyngbya sp. FACHB-238]MBD2400371.1 glycosyltransferase family 2 protein [Leptolyngbya sp. FACHB-239]MBD2406912.1 glycosyltransferase family 2 protein [Leptolyngbya sp. FACHB-402]
MNIVGRVKLPKSSDISDLYIRCNEAASLDVQENSKRTVLQQGGVVSSSSYFNSFYENYYVKYTSLNSIYYLLKLEGDFRVAIYREVQSGERETILEEKIEQCQLSKPVKLAPINLVQTEKAGRIYLEITCLSTQGIFAAGWIATDQPKEREVSLGIVICTFKKENYVRETLTSLLQDELLQDKSFKVFVSDNGRTLDHNEFNDPRVKLFPNKNAGGSGGFTRGIMEALAEKSSSHLLLMDDDIELESESICRLFAVHEYAKTEFIIAGGLLDLNNKQVLYEAGATYNEDPATKGAFGSLTALNYRIDLSQNASLNQLLVEEDADYGGFWFCSFSRQLVEKLNLPLPLFIKLDDVEFCLRAKMTLGIPIATFPSMAVWHIPASAKNLNWETYYYFRNDLITYAVHFSPSYEHTVSNLTQEIALSLLMPDFDRAQMLIKAFDDYLKGPDWIMSIDPEVVHPSTLKLSRSYENQQNVDLLTNVQLMAQWSSIVDKGRTEWSIASKNWKNAAQELMSHTFWQKYLGLKEPTLSSSIRHSL